MAKGHHYEATIQFFVSLIFVQMNDTMMRLAAPGDIPGILKLIRQRPGNMKERSVDDITAMVYKQHGVVAIASKDIHIVLEKESEQTSRTIACGEVVFFVEVVLIDVDTDGEVSNGILL